MDNIYLTEEEIALLKESKINDLKKNAIARCLHRNNKGDTLVLDPTNSHKNWCRCTICGTEFKALDMPGDTDYVKSACTIVTFAIETLKITAPKMTEDELKEFENFCKIIPYVDYLPTLFERVGKRAFR